MKAAEIIPATVQAKQWLPYAQKRAKEIFPDRKDFTAAHIEFACPERGRALIKRAGETAFRAVG